MVDLKGPTMTTPSEDMFVARHITKFNPADVTLKFTKYVSELRTTKSSYNGNYKDMLLIDLPLEQVEYLGFNSTNASKVLKRAAMMWSFILLYNDLDKTDEDEIEFYIDSFEKHMTLTNSDYIKESLDISKPVPVPKPTEGEVTFPGS